MREGARIRRPDWIALVASLLALYGAVEVFRWRGTELWWVTFVALLHIGLGGALLSFVDRRHTDLLFTAFTGLRRTETGGVEPDPTVLYESRRELRRLVPAALALIAVMASPLAFFELMDMMAGKSLEEGTFPLGISALATAVPLMRWAKGRQA
jgi:hypothetical protein